MENATEQTREGEEPEPGSWVHFTQSMPLFLDLFWQLEASYPDSPSGCSLPVCLR